jgi:esterase/lipase superfamily enzyme
VKEKITWYSPRLREENTLVRWGTYGTPILLYPTAGGDAEECERFLMLRALDPLVQAGRIKVYSVDSTAGRVMTSGEGSAEYCSWIQSRFLSFVHREVVPAVRKDCNSEDIELVVAGSSIGAFNALATLCRFPEDFRTALCLSGTFDLVRFLPNHGYTMDFYFSSPIHFLPNLGEGPQLEKLRSRFALFAFGEGQWEAPEESWRMASILGAKGIPNRVDSWGADYDHNWPTWREMLPRYLEEFA